MVSQQQWRMVNRAAVILTLGVLVVISQTLDPALDDFKRYWQASVDLLRHDNPYFTRKDYFYPPFFVYLIQPFGLLQHTDGQYLWFVLNTLLFGGFVGLALRASRSHYAQRAWGIVLLVMLIAPPTRISLQLGQVSLLIALLLTAMLLLERRNASIAGLLLALASLIRINPAFLGIAYLLSPPRRVAWWSMVWGSVLVASSLLVYGGKHYLLYIQTIVFANVEREGVYPYAAEHNISIYGFWSRMFIDNPHVIPITHAPLVAHILIIGCTIMVLAVCLWVGREAEDATTRLLQFSVWLCGMMLLLPTNGYYNLVILLLPILGLVRTLEEHRNDAIRNWLVLAVGLLCIPPRWSNSHPVVYRVAHMDWGLWLLTPSLYGLCLLMGVLVVVIRQRTSAQPT